MSRSRVPLLCATLALAATLPASAVDTVLLANATDATIEAYDALGVVSSTALSGGGVPFDLAASPGGRWVYASDTGGGVHFVNPTSLATSRGSVISTAGVLLAADADRASVYASDGRLMRLGASSLQFSSLFASATDFGRLATHRARPLLIANRPAEAVMWETTAPAVSFTESGSRDDVAFTDAGHFAVSAFSQGDDLVVEACTVYLSSCAQTVVEKAATASLSITTPDDDEIHIGTDDGVLALLPDGLGGFSHSIAYGAGAVVDIASSPDTYTVYVLYADRIDVYGHHGTFDRTLVTFDEEDRDTRRSMVVVPAQPLADDTCATCLEAGVVELIAEAAERAIEIPWLGSVSHLTCDDCAKDEVADGAKAAGEFLDALDEDEEVLDPGHLTEFLQGWYDLGQADAEWALDDLLIDVDLAD